MVATQANPFQELSLKMIASNIMKRINILIISLCLSLVSFGQLMNERRVYYLDITGSMAGYNGSPNIWNSVVSNLEKAVDNIEDENTEIVIKTFTDSKHPVKTLVSVNATATGKATVKEKLTSVELVYDCHTDIYVPIQDFYKNEISIANVDYFFLMTDGNQHKTGVSELQKQIQKWNDKTNNGKKHIYGFYVMLTSAAYSEQIEGWIKSQEHFWTVKSANVNINLVRPEKEYFICNIRNNDKNRYIDIPMTGKIADLGLSVSGENEYCKVMSTKLIDKNTLRVYFKNKQTLARIPSLSNLSLTISKPNSQFDFLLNDRISVKCDNITPWGKICISLCSLLLLGLLLWFLIIKPIKYPTFKTYKKNILIEKSSRIISQTKVDFTGARKVIFSNKREKQSVLNKFFCGKIITLVNAEFESPISFTPTRNRKAANTVGKAYIITPNPIQRSGIATIINQQKQLKITLN